MSKKPVVIYGASGYTGRLVAEAMRHYQIPFIAAGRNGPRVEEAMKLVPGIETAEYEVAEVNHDLESLVELFSGAEVVCNTVGPMWYYAPLVVEACARAGVRRRRQGALALYRLHVHRAGNCRTHCAGNPRNRQPRSHLQSYRHSDLWFHTDHFQHLRVGG
jgi:uncharacterized protein YbjT (DUF2867 family)